MKKLILMVVLISAASLLFGCESDPKSVDSTQENFQTTASVNEEQKVFVGESSFSVAEINQMVKETFNCEMYYSGSRCFETGTDFDNAFEKTNLGVAFGKEIEYDLYFRKASATEEETIDLKPAKIYLVITNHLHPSSTAEASRFYDYEIDLTAKGLRSDFSYMGSTKEKNGQHGDATLLGHFSMYIDKIEKPVYQKKNSDRRETLESSIILFGQQNQEPPDDFARGTYTVYVRPYHDADLDTVVFFEHENGAIYRGYYYFVQYADASRPADLAHLTLLEGKEKDYFISEFERLKEDGDIVFTNVVVK